MTGERSDTTARRDGRVWAPQELVAVVIGNSLRKQLGTATSHNKDSTNIEVTFNRVRVVRLEITDEQRVGSSIGGDVLTSHCRQGLRVGISVFGVGLLAFKRQIKKECIRLTDDRSFD